MPHHNTPKPTHAHRLYDYDRASTVEPLMLTKYSGVAANIATNINNKSPHTMCGITPLQGSIFSFKDKVSLVLPRDTDSIDPSVVRLLKPYL